MLATEVCRNFPKPVGFTQYHDALTDPLRSFPKLLEDSGCPKFHNAGNVTYNDRGKHCKLEGQRG